MHRFSGFCDSEDRLGGSEGGGAIARLSATWSMIG